MTGDKLGKQGGSGSGSQFPQSGTNPLRSKNPHSFAIWGNRMLYANKTGKEKRKTEDMYSDVNLMCFFFLDLGTFSDDPHG